MELVDQYMAIFCNFSPTSNHLHTLQVENCDSNSRLVVDEDDNGKFRPERIKDMIKLEQVQRPASKFTLVDYFTPYREKCEQLFILPLCFRGKIISMCFFSTATLEALSLTVRLWNTLSFVIRDPSRLYILKRSLMLYISLW